MSVRIATAEWADPALVEQTYEYHPGTSWLGRSATENDVPLGYGDDRHVCLVSGSRGGKGASSIVNNLIVWPGSLVCVDPKGENATIAAARRGQGSQYSKGMGQTVRVLDPFHAAQIDDSLRGHFNPLDTLDPENEETVDEAGRIADAIVVIHEGGTNDPFWDESARSILKGLLLHVITSPRFEGFRNLLTVRKLIMRGDWEAIENLKQQGETELPSSHAMLWTALQNNPAFGGLVAGLGDTYANMLRNSPKQYESVLQVANRNTEFIDSPAMQRCLESSDFQLSELKTDPAGLSVFLCLPQRYMSTHYRWLRMMISLTVTEMEKVRGRPATGHPVLLMLDEFAGLKFMEIILSSVAQLAGFGVKMFFVLQSLEQLKAVYKDNWETFLANSGLKIFFNLEDNFSREYVAKLIGETEVVRELHTASDSKSESESFSQSTTRSRSETKGTSTSIGTSVSDGTNSSVSKGQSWGISRSKGKSWNWSTSEKWTPGLIFRSYEPGVTEGKSESLSTNTTKSEGWNTGQSKGVSHSTSKSRTDGTSESVTTGTSETEGITRGTSMSRTSGTNESIQKRALVTPDEIGQVFARVDDRAHRAYPGLALVVISGARPVALRRVNYFEDYQFIGLFDPHPDYPYAAPMQLTVEGDALGFSLSEYGLSLSSWSIGEGRTANTADQAALVVASNNVPAAHLLVPRRGLVTQVQKITGNNIKGRTLFSLLHYDDGAEQIDPFGELRAFIDRLKAQLAADKEAADRAKRDSATHARRRKQIALGAGAVALILIVVIGIGALVGSQRTRARKEQLDQKITHLQETARMDATFGGESVADATNLADAFKEECELGFKDACAKSLEQSQLAARLPANGTAAGNRDAVSGVAIDYSQFAGLKPGNTAEQVASRYGAPVSEDGNEKSYGSVGGIMVTYQDGGVKRVEMKGNALDLARSRAGSDALLDLFGHSENDAIAVLGPPPARLLQGGHRITFWSFPMAGRPPGHTNGTSGQTIILTFDPQDRCEVIRITW